MSADAARAQMTIGEVLGQLRGEFPDITLSKIRFLESAGLIEPARSPSGYRMFAPGDVERLRFILAAQRDEYLPLRVIKERLQALDREPHDALASRRRMRRTGPRTLVATGGSRTDVAGPNGSGSNGTGSNGSGLTVAGVDAADHDGAVDVRLTRRQLLDASGIGADGLAELEEFGLVRRRGIHYDGDALAVVRAAMALRTFGLEPRHLRVVWAAAEREVGLIEQAVAPMLRRRDSAAHARAEDTAGQIAVLVTRLHTALVSVGLRETLDG